MKIEIDFEGMLKQAIANALAPEAIQPVIQQKMNEVVASAINEQFRHGAPLKRLVEQSMAKEGASRVAAGFFLCRKSPRRTAG